MTGGYGGIGEAVCRASRAGAKVAIAGHDAAVPPLARVPLQSQATTRGRPLLKRSRSLIRSEWYQVVDHFGRLDILVNCIGLNREEKAEEITEEMFDYVYNVNLKSAMFQAQAAARYMIAQGTGGDRSTLALYAHCSRCVGAAMPRTVLRKVA